MVVVAAVVFGGGTYEYGVNISLHCFVIGIDPPHNVTWQVPVSSTSLERGLLVNNNDVPSLSFEARREDEGDYTCQVVGGNAEQFEATVTVGNKIPLHVFELLSQT